jgi:hypothetical protein
MQLTDYLRFGDAAGIWLRYCACKAEVAIGEDLPMHGTILEVPVKLPPSIDALEMQILEQLNEEAVIGLDSLIQMLPEHSWNQIFHAVDRLARAGRIVLRRHAYDYTLFSAAYPA